MDFPNYPLFLALLRQDPAETGVVRAAPERKVDEKEDLGDASREEEEDSELEAQ